MKKPYYITTAIAYTSGKPHIGNTYEIVLADAIAANAQVAVRQSKAAVRRGLQADMATGVAYVAVMRLEPGVIKQKLNFYTIVFGRALS